MLCRTFRLVALCLLVAMSALAAAQVLSPVELKDPEMRRLQQQYLGEIAAIGAELNQHPFPYSFYFSRKLDIDEKLQKQLDQRSIRVERYHDRVALAISGNYYASYAAHFVDADHRLRQTYIDVIFPILRAVASRLGTATEIDCVAVEVSHHVRKKVMRIDSEFPENVVVVVPREIVLNLSKVQDLNGQQQLLLSAEAYQNGEPTLLWLTGDKPEPGLDSKTANALKKTEPAALRPAVAPVEGDGRVRLAGLLLSGAPGAQVPPELRSAPLHDSRPEALELLRQKHQGAIASMVSGMDATANFVAYAPPAFVSFKQGAYLQLSLMTMLDRTAAGSQYKVAALAFDRHIAHLIRPTLGYLSAEMAIDGLNFSTTVKVAGDRDELYSEAVEFVLPLSALRCYEQYDCTGQQVLNAGLVLINGERVGIDLQTAESAVASR